MMKESFNIIIIPSIKFNYRCSVCLKSTSRFWIGYVSTNILNEHPPGPSKTIADVGCGYGPIGLMIAKVSPHHQITMVDVNKRALNLAEKNKKQIKLITSLSKKVMVYHN